MPKRRNEKIKAWSFSRYDTYETCPAKAKYKFIDKLKEPGSPAMDRGAQIHDMAEAYIVGRLPRLPKELAQTQFKRLFQDLRKQYKKKDNGMIVEEMWAFTNQWHETAWNDWDNCWVRIKLDAAYHIDPVTLAVVDWKTGKFREQQNEKYVQQLELYALGALLLHDHVEEVRPRLAYLDQDITFPSPKKPLVYTPKDIPKLKKRWEQRVQAMLKDGRFAPRPNWSCRFCHFRKDNGGPCQY